MKIVVSSNCQTGGIAASLREINSKLVVIPKYLPGHGERAANEELIALIDE